MSATTHRATPVPDERDVTAVKDYESLGALVRIALALPPIERAYALVRFMILRSKLLAMMDLILPSEGRILDVGCGFGLFSVYFGLMSPARAILGIDPDARRVGIARNVAAKLGLEHNQYLVGTTDDVVLPKAFDAVFMLDVLHHVPRDAQLPLLQLLWDHVRPGGVLLIKDITTEPHWKLKFTELLDRAMVGWDEPLNYRHNSEWSAVLRGIGFHVRGVRVPDVLPYPHVILVATRPVEAVAP